MAAMAQGGGGHIRQAVAFDPHLRRQISQATNGAENTTDGKVSQALLDMRGES